MHSKLLAVLIAAFATAAVAKPLAPLQAPDDGRFRTVAYSDTKVTELPAQIGRFLEIEFSPEETEIKYAFGDKKAWDVAIRDNTLYLKPAAAFADTNLKVVTNKRTYWFDLVMKSKKRKPVWHLTFKYPYEAPKVLQAPEPDPAIIAARMAKLEHEKIEERLGKANAPQVIPMERTINKNYEVLGPKDITPTSVADNGEVTVITFAGGKPQPVISAIEADGSESRVPFHVDSGLVILHRVAKTFLLKRGTAVATLTNQNYKPIGTNPTTNTISDEVRREIIGAE